MDFDITIQNKYYLILLIIIPLLMLLQFFYYRFAKKRAFKFANYGALQKITGNKIITKNLTGLMFRSLSLILIIMSLANISVWYLAKSQNYEYVILLDSGASMNAIDVEPTRFVVAKNFTKQFYSQLNDLNVGFISFSGTIIQNSRPTEDFTKISTMIDSSQIVSSGTDLGLAITSAINMFQNTGQNKSKRILLVSDGHDNVGIQLADAIKLAQEEHIEIMTIGVGTLEGGNFITNPSIKPVISKLNDENLKIISNSTRSEYFNLESSNQISDIISLINEASFESFIEKNLSFIFLLSAFLLLVLEWILANTRFRVLP